MEAHPSDRAENLGGLYASQPGPDGSCNRERASRHGHCSKSENSFCNKPASSGIRSDSGEQQHCNSTQRCMRSSQRRPLMSRTPAAEGAAASRGRFSIQNSMISWKTVPVFCGIMLSVLGADAQSADAIGKLRVATCNPGVRPFVYSEDNVPDGYEIVQFNHMYDYMIKRVQAVQDDVERNYLHDLVGHIPPQVQMMPVHELLNSLTNNSIDMGFCKLTITPDRSHTIDFTVPYVDSSLATGIRETGGEISSFTVFFRAFRRPNAWAIFALLLLLILSMIFAHLLWFVERKDNININRAYGPGVFDSWWMAVVTALTVGYGDTVPVTVSGKWVTILWMFFATYCLGLYGAAITTDQIEVTNTQASHTLEGVADLAGKTVIITHHTPIETVESYLPTAQIKQVPSVQEAIALMRSLDEDEVFTQTFFIENLHTAKYYLRIERENGNKELRLSDYTFNDHQIAIGVSRPNGTKHRAYQVINQAMVDYMYGDGRQMYLDDLEELLESDESELDSGGEVAATLANINQQWGIALLLFVVCWLFFVALHYRREIIQARLKMGLRKAMGLGSKYSGQELEVGASALFKKLDTDKSGALDLPEILQCLQGVGFHVTEKEVAEILNSESDKAGLSGIRRESSTRSVDIQIDEAKFQNLMRQLLLSETMANNDAELHAPILSKHLQALARDANGELDKISGKVLKALDRIEEAVSMGVGSGIKLAKLAEGDVPQPAKENSHRSLPDVAPKNGTDTPKETPRRDAKRQPVEED